MHETKTENADNGTERSRIHTDVQANLHPAWQAMIRFCRDLGYGEIACVKIHDGVPIGAEVATKKIRWC
jgi:hypothetical protein